MARKKKGIDITIWTPIYWGDYRKDTKFLTLEQHGAYFMLIGIYWESKGSMPADTNLIYKAVGSVTISEQKAVDFVLGNYFKVRDGCYRNKRLDEELHKAIGMKENKSKAGKAGMEARYNKNLTDGTTEVQQNEQHGANPTPLPLPNKSKDLFLREDLKNIVFIFAEEDWKKLESRWPVNANMGEAYQICKELIETGTVTWQELYDAADRYFENKPEKQEWLFLSTWLKNKRYNDFKPKPIEPAAPPPPPKPLEAIPSTATEPVMQAWEKISQKFLETNQHDEVVCSAFKLCGINEYHGDRVGLKAPSRLTLAKIETRKSSLETIFSYYLPAYRLTLEFIL